MSEQEPETVEFEHGNRPERPSLERPEDPQDPALQPETLGIDDTDTALATEDASDPAE